MWYAAAAADTRKVTSKSRLMAMPNLTKTVVFFKMFLQILMQKWCFKFSTAIFWNSLTETSEVLVKSRLLRNVHQIYLFTELIWYLIWYIWPDNLCDQNSSQLLHQDLKEKLPVNVSYSQSVTKHSFKQNNCPAAFTKLVIIFGETMDKVYMLDFSTFKVALLLWFHTFCLFQSLDTFLKVLVTMI